MAALDKLIDLLEKLKQENPEFHDKAGKALDVLVDEDVEDKVDINEEVEFDDSYVEMEDHEYNKIAEFRNNTTKLILEIGVLLQNFENKKKELLDQIDTNQSDLLDCIEKIKSQKGCDEDADYELVFPDGDKKAAFRKI